MSNHVALQRRISDAVEEYNQKLVALPSEIENFKKASEHLISCCTITGTYGRERIDLGSPYLYTLEKNLLVSAWITVYKGLSIDIVAPAKDKESFERSLSQPAPFTLDNIRASFGKYLTNPREHILRGLAEAFSSLDNAYKSHEKVKIGVAGLPKRIILNNVSGYGWGRERLQNTINALAVVMSRPMFGYTETGEILKDGEAFKNSHDIWLKTFSNGNGHLFFGKTALREINLALAEYYGDVLPDTPQESDTKKQSTAVSKDLQYYPTPLSVAERIVNDVSVKDKLVLEPSCGCGRIMEVLRDKGAEVHGIEVDYERAMTARSKGFSVHIGNFLECEPEAKYDVVVMNPPFYGKHYVKHIEHALKFLKPNGILKSILPATARYDHGLLTSGRWEDLPTGSFSESGTNVQTTIYSICKI